MATYSNRLLPVYALIIGTALLIAIGGGTHEYSQVFLLFLTGALLIITPIRKLPGRWVMISLFSILAWMLISTWMPFPTATASDWVAQKLPGVKLGGGVSPQPVLSTEKMLLFIVGLCWFFLAIQRPMSHYRRIEFQHWVMWSICGLALITILCMFLGVQHPLTWGTHRFSFFPNHNQSGSVFALGAILTMGFVVRSMKKREWEMFAYIAVFVVICLALFMGMSRSAVIMMAGGCVLYLLLTLEKKHYRFYLKLGVPLFVIFGAFFLLYGENLLDEFVSLLKTGGVQGEIRVRIWQDTLKMIATFPLCGVGLGNFRFIFPFFMDGSATAQAIHHPESDFLWVWCELGLVGVILVTTTIVLLILRLDPKDIFRSKGNRLVGVIALFMFLCASMIEVSGHRLGTAILAMLIYGINQPEDVELRKVAGLSIVSRFVGAVLVLIGSAWGWGMLSSSPVVSTEVIRFAGLDIAEIYEKYEPERVPVIIDHWVERYPLISAVHNLKGLVSVSMGETARATEAFDHANHLDPVRWRPFINRGVYIYPLDFAVALQYWQEGLAIAGNSRYDAFDFICSRIPSERIPELRELVYGDRGLQFYYFRRLRNMKIEYSRELGLELAINPELDGFRSEEKQALLWRFAEINGPAILKRLVERHPVLGSENWTIRAQLNAAENNFREASRLALMNFPEPEMIDLTNSRKLSAIRTEYLLGSNDPLKVIALVQKLKEEGKYEDAMVTMEVARSKGVSHEYLQYQLALVYFHLGKYEDSWERWEQLIKQSIEWELRS